MHVDLSLLVRATPWGGNFASMPPSQLVCCRTASAQHVTRPLALLTFVHDSCPRDSVLKLCGAYRSLLRSVFAAFDREKLTAEDGGRVCSRRLGKNPACEDGRECRSFSQFLACPALANGTYDGQGKEAVWLAGRDGDRASRAPWAGFF